MLQVGIHENVKISKVEVNDNNILALTFEEGGGIADATSQQVNFLDELNTTDTQVSTGPALVIRLWPFEYGEYVKTVDEMMMEIKKLKTKLNTLLKLHMTEDAMKKGFNIMQGIKFDNPSDPEEFNRLLKNDQVLAKIYSNMATQFVSLFTPFTGDRHLYRVKFRRQSVTKHYADLPRVGEWIEPMNIPKEQSKLAFDKYEISKGLNVGTPVDAASTAADPGLTQEQQDNVDAIFGQ